MERGVTHFTHWFHPMTGLTAEKHDSFIKVVGNLTAGDIVTSFKGKALVAGEPDASSFPRHILLLITFPVSGSLIVDLSSGGLRPTHAARGYTVWDPQTPPFINDVSGEPTLYIPTCFYSWQGPPTQYSSLLRRRLSQLFSAGHALDRKIPLLRSQFALEKSVKKLFAAIKEEGHNEVWTDSGVEQEFFLIDSQYTIGSTSLVFGKLHPHSLA